MSGYTVALEADGRRQIFMVREPDADKACELVRRVQGKHHIYPLSPVSDETLDYFDIQSDRTVTIHTHHCDAVVCCSDDE